MTTLLEHKLEQAASRARMGICPIKDSADFYAALGFDSVQVGKMRFLHWLFGQRHPDIPCGCSESTSTQK